MAWNNYFELKWTRSGQSVTRRFRMYQGGMHQTSRRLHGFQRSLDGHAVIVRVPFMPRSVEGEVPFYSTDQQTDPWGSKADLLEAIEATDLQAKMYDDATFWDAHVVGDWQPVSRDPFGNVQSVMFRVEGR